MTTHLQQEIRKPIQKLNLNAQLFEVDLPKNITRALKSQIWREAMETEMEALLKNETWTSAPPSPSQTYLDTNGYFEPNETYMEITKPAIV